MASYNGFSYASNRWCWRAEVWSPLDWPWMNWTVKHLDFEARGAESLCRSCRISDIMRPFFYLTLLYETLYMQVHNSQAELSAILEVAGGISWVPVTSRLHNHSLISFQLVPSQLIVCITRLQGVLLTIARFQTLKPPTPSSPITISLSPYTKTKASSPLSPNARSSCTQFWTRSQPWKAWPIAQTTFIVGSSTRTRSRRRWICTKDYYRLSGACQPRSCPKSSATAFQNSTTCLPHHNWKFTCFWHKYAGHGEKLLWTCLAYGAGCMCELLLGIGGGKHFAMTHGSSVPEGIHSRWHSGAPTPGLS